MSLSHGLVANFSEGDVVSGIQVVGAASLGDVVRYLRDGTPPKVPAPDERDPREIAAGFFDLADVVGQEQARRALEVAAAGGHHQESRVAEKLVWEAVGQGRISQKAI